MKIILPFLQYIPTIFLLTIRIYIQNLSENIYMLKIISLLNFKFAFSVYYATQDFKFLVPASFIWNSVYKKSFRVNIFALKLNSISGFKFMYSRDWTNSEEYYFFHFICPKIVLRNPDIFNKYFKLYLVNV